MSSPIPSVASGGSREYDVIILGATGFTGQLAAEYVTERYGPSSSSPVRFALAGRSEQRLRKLVNDHLVALDSLASSLPLVEVDVTDTASVLKMTQLTKVVANFVGPFDLYGENVVASCVDTATHYCDCTGEFPWVKKMQQKYSQKAKEKKVKIVPFCAFDCIPSDIGTMVLQQEAQKKFGVPCTEVRERVDGMKGGFSGGTAVSFFGILKNLSCKDMHDPYYLCRDITNQQLPQRKPTNIFKRILKYEPDVGYTTQFPAEFLNSKAVYWSNSLQNNSYGESFVFSERFSLGLGFMRTLLFGITTFLFMGPAICMLKLLLQLPMCWWLLNEFVFPRLSRRGPPRSQFRHFYFKCRLIGQTAPDVQGNDHKLVCRVMIDTDPGYVGSARMVSECSLCLALNLLNCPNTYGVLSPAVALGPPVVDRLTNAGIKICIEE